MAWEWSHTSEAYENALANLEDMPIEDLRVIWAEWEAFDADNFDGFNQDSYDAAIVEAESLSGDVLVGAIWERMGALSTCTNGGFHLWACPYGCGCHLVSVDREEE